MILTEFSGGDDMSPTVLCSEKRATQKSSSTWQNNINNLGGNDHLGIRTLIFINTLAGYRMCTSNVPMVKICSN